MPVKQTKLVPEQLKTAIQNDRGPLGFFMNGSGATSQLITEPPPKPRNMVPVARAGSPVGTSGVTAQAAAQAPPTGNFDKAAAELKMTPQEQGLYMRHLSNLWGEGGVNNPDGSRQTLGSQPMVIDGRAYLLPTVNEGKILSAQLALEKAQAEGLDKFPSYASNEEAMARYSSLQKFMERDLAEWSATRRSAPPGLINTPQ